MNLEDHCIPNQIFRLADGKAAKFFSREMTRPGPCPVTLIRDGHLYTYDLKGQYLCHPEHRLNPVEALPKANWEVALGRCRLGQRLLMRDYTLTELVEIVPGLMGPEYMVQHRGQTVTKHNHNGWAIQRNCENDVVAYFDFVAAVPVSANTHVEGLQNMVNRLRRALRLSDKVKFKQEFDRATVGMELHLTNLLRTIS